MWIDNHLMHCTGDTVFVVRVLNIVSGDERVVALDQPARCATTRKPIVRGWAGEINNRSVTALGVARVVGERFVLDGDGKEIEPSKRIELEPLQKVDLRDTLSRLGYAELLDQTATTKEDA